MSNLLSKEHQTNAETVSVDEVVRALELNPKAYYDPEKNQRKVPVFAYDKEGKPVRVAHWALRHVAPIGMTMAEAEAMGLDYYLEGRGWIRLGKKAEREYGAN